MRISTTDQEARVRIVLSQRGIERVEVWGRDDSDHEQAMQLFLKLTGVLNQVNETCRSWLVSPLSFFPTSEAKSEFDEEIHTYGVIWHAKRIQELPYTVEAPDKPHSGVPRPATASDGAFDSPPQAEDCGEVQRTNRWWTERMRKTEKPIE
jgi:hypothetical protein